MKKAIKITVIVLAAVLVLFAGVSFFFGTQVVAGSTQLVTTEETSGLKETVFARHGFDYDRFCSEHIIEQLTVTSSFDGHIIPADYIYAPGTEGSKDNTALHTTFGYWEKHDLTDYIHYIKEQAPERTLGVWGTSFGGATAGLALGNAETDAMVDFLVLDCPVSSMRWMVEDEMRRMDIGIPVSYMTFCGNMVNRIQLGFSYADADVPSAIKDIDTPVLIINSRSDTTTPAFMGQDIYDAITSESKSIWTVEDSEHAEIWMDHNSEYIQRVQQLVHSVEN